MIYLLVCMSHDCWDCFFLTIWTEHKPEKFLIPIPFSENVETNISLKFLLSSI